MTESFVAMPFLVAAVHGVGLIQKRLALRLASAAEVRILPCPFDAVPLIEAGPGRSRLWRSRRAGAGR